MNIYCKDQTFQKKEGASSYQQNCVKLVIHPDEQLNCLSELAPPSTNQLLTGKVERLQKSAPGTSHQRYYLIIATFCSYTKLYHRQLSYLHLDLNNLRSQQFSTRRSFLKAKRGFRPFLYKCVLGVLKYALFI